MGMHPMLEFQKKSYVLILLILEVDNMSEDWSIEEMCLCVSRKYNTFIMSSSCKANIKRD